MKLRRLSSRFYAADQLEPEDIGRLAELGIRSVINNRPDGEAIGQPGSHDIELACRQAGLGYCHVPAQTKSVKDGELEAFRAAIRSLPEPVCAFCRTGTRASVCWALSKLGTQSTYSLIEAVVGAGFPSEDVELQMGLRLRQQYESFQTPAKPGMLLPG